jgi:glyoxylase-like metal-dependent hydrolase (beta-lactamase superfamily II)
MINEILPNIFSWNIYSEEKSLNFNGYLIINNCESVIIDPPELSEDDEKELISIVNINSSSQLKAILLTNVHHARASHSLKNLFSIPVWINKFDRINLETPSSKTFKDGDILFSGIEAIQLEEQKTPGETAFYIREQKIMILGDALIGKVPGEVKMLPPEKFRDAFRAKENLKILLKYEFENLLLGDGTSILKNANKTVSTFLYS